MKNNEQRLYEKINQSIPTNSPNYQQRLKSISSLSQTSLLEKSWLSAEPIKQAPFFKQLGIAASVICFAFLFSLNLMIGNIKSESVQKGLQLELTESFFNPSKEFLENNTIETSLNQLLSDME